MFNGPQQPFGRLCHYHTKAGHPLMPTSAAGLFIGYRIETGIRFRNVLLVADYDSVRSNGFQWRFVRSVPVKECYFPANVTFPFAEAHAISFTTMAPSFAPPPAEDLMGPITEEPILEPEPPAAHVIAVEPAAPPPATATQGPLFLRAQTTARPA